HECQEIWSANINQKEDHFLIYERDLLEEGNTSSNIFDNLLNASFTTLSGEFAAGCSPNPYKHNDCGIAWGHNSQGEGLICRRKPTVGKPSQKLILSIRETPKKSSGKGNSYASTSFSFGSVSLSKDIASSPKYWCKNAIPCLISGVTFSILTKSTYWFI
ncbi:hypothetical protein OC498_14060, partial [Acinetobacter bohemicus]|nr:hypothetical protein [Acinetobacter bohemicus]